MTVTANLSEFTFPLHSRTSKQEELEATKAQMDVPYYMFNIFISLLVLILVASIYYFFLRERFICNALCGTGGNSGRSSADEGHVHHTGNSAEAIQGSHPQLNQHRSSNLTTVTTNTSSPRSILRSSLTTTTITNPLDPVELNA